MLTQSRTRGVRRTIVGVAAAALAFAVPGVAAAAPDLGPRGAEYVSLGDSYVANGGFDSFDRNGSCMQAPDGVGPLVAKRLPGVSFANWACGGADTLDFTDNTPMGPQVNGLSDKTKYVSISIGGNDNDLFANAISACFFQQTCTPQVRADAERKLAELPARLDRAYSAVKEKAPNAKVVVLGYSKILPDDAKGCFVEVTMGQDVVEFNNELQRGLNDTIADAADRHGFEMVNHVQDDKHTVCAPDGQRYVTALGLHPGDKGIPFHPTLLGREYAADLLAEAFRADA